MSNPNAITLSESEAATMTHAYQNDSTFAGMTISAKIPNAAYQDIITQPGCVEVRTNFAKNSNGDLTLVVVGVDGNDMTSGAIMNRFGICPSNCPQNSPLM
jgi:hypothetical protein